MGSLPAPQLRIDTLVHELDSSARPGDCRWPSTRRGPRIAGSVEVAQIHAPPARALAAPRRTLRPAAPPVPWRRRDRRRPHPWARRSGTRCGADSCRQLRRARRGRRLRRQTAEEILRVIEIRDQIDLPLRCRAPRDAARADNAAPRSPPARSRPNRKWSPRACSRDPACGPCSTSASSVDRKVARRAAGSRLRYATAARTQPPRARPDAAGSRGAVRSCPGSHRRRHSDACPARIIDGVRIVALRLSAVTVVMISAPRPPPPWKRQRTTRSPARRSAREISLELVGGRRVGVVQPQLTNAEHVDGRRWPGIRSASRCRSAP